MGIERLKEALETNDWESNELGGGFDPDDFPGDEDEGGEGSGFGIEAAEMEMEMFGMKQAIYDDGNRGENLEPEGKDEDIEQLQSIMTRLQAVRGTYYFHSFQTVGER